MLRPRILLASIVALGALASPTGATPPPGGPYALAAVALAGGGATDVYLTVTTTAGPIPERIDKVQLQAPRFGGEPFRSATYLDVPSPAGVAVLHVGAFPRHQPLLVRVHVRGIDQSQIEATTEVRLRPDLTVSAVAAPASAVRRQQLEVTATVAELAGDTGATATATLLDGSAPLASKPVQVGPGGSTTVSFAAALGHAGRHDLRVVVSGANPAEAVVSNNEAATTLDVHMYTSDGVVSTDHWVATGVAERVLRAGGNAVDAAVAAEFALNVADPHLSGIGGGTVALVRLANGEAWAIDGREVAPHATTPTQFAGKAAGAVGIQGYSVGVPATLRTLDEMLRRWGTMSLADVLREPTELADAGVPVGTFLAAGSAELRTLDLQPETIELFRRPDRSPLQVGDTLVQHDLARTFRLLAAQGVDVFYRGEIAHAIVDAQTRLSPTKPIVDGQGRMTLDDLARLRVTVERPLSQGHGGATVLAPPPSTNGGVVLLETLGVYEKVAQANPQADFGWGSFASMHTALEALRLAFADRDLWIGDDDVVDVPTGGLLSDGYLAARAAQIRLDGRIPVALPGDPRPFGGAAVAPAAEADDPTGHTTHLSIVDRWGNAVSMTSTVADTFGSGITVPGYGFVLNDSLNLFNLTPRFDPIAGNPGANDAAPDKRPMGSMAPTIVVRDGDPILLTGTYGSAFIPSLVFNVVSNVVDHGMPLAQAVEAPRMWGAVANVAPPSANFARNPGFPQATIDQMRALGDQIALRTTPGFGSTSSAGVDLATLDLVGASDRRQHSDPAAAVIQRP
jgi:gamma-glutamyltranspeptidase/glutathione hydrolase